MSTQAVLPPQPKVSTTLPPPTTPPPIVVGTPSTYAALPPPPQGSVQYSEPQYTAQPQYYDGRPQQNGCGEWYVVLSCHLIDSILF